MALDSRPNPISMVLMPNTCSNVEMMGILPPRRNCQRLFAESFGEAFLRSLVCRERDGAYVSLPAVHGGDFYLYGIGSDSHDVIGKQLRNLVMILMRNQSAGYFGVCLEGSTVLEPSPV